jgi:hypothetical protein
MFSVPKDAPYLYLMLFLLILGGCCCMFWVLCWSGRSIRRETTCTNPSAHGKFQVLYPQRTNRGCWTHHSLV